MTTDRALPYSETAASFFTRVRAELDSREWRSAARTIEDHWDHFALTEPQVLLDAFTALPSEAFIETPSRLIEVDYLRYVASGAAPHTFRRRFNPAADAPTPDLPLRDRLFGITSRVAAHRSAGRIADAVADAVEARRVLDTADADETAELRTALPHLTIHWAQALDVGDSPLAANEYEQTCAAAVATGQPRIARRAAASLAWMHAEQGRIHNARTWLDRATGFDVAIDRYDVPLLLAEALIAVDGLDTEKARRHLAAADQFVAGEYWAASLWLHALLSTSPEDIIITETLMTRETRRHVSRAVEPGAHRRQVALARWTLRVRRGTLQTPGGDDDRIPSAIAAERAYRQGRFADAQTVVSRLPKDDLPPRLGAAVLLIAAASDLRLGRRDQAVDAFHRAHDMIQHEGLSMVFATIDACALKELAEASGLSVDSAVLQFLHDSTDDPRPAMPSLSRRERQVLALLASGMSNNEMAETLFITVNTLKSTVRNLYKKLGVHDRAEASDLAHRLGLDDGA
ncbi:response regulator transcription factor [Agreia pratensis]|uniref:helix-turn-helix transcriptional regulator n=1 Tax=Agreia pratensis TaxID=150121 RepID=UPI00188D8648|nr:LuxR C-terminal-related transcriptional regulator [Agreia pratensis]MBF4632972.1 response regulator transcription factor [Agreia pratensis]